MKKVDDDTKDIIDSFVSEGYERIEEAEIQVQRLSSETDPETVNTIFRLFHSIKGSAGFLNFENIKKLTHEAETFLDIFRKEKITLLQEHIDLIYKTMDLMKQLISNVEKTMEDKGFEEPTAVVVQEINECIADLKSGQEKKPAVSVPDFSLENLVTPEMAEKFVSESLDKLDSSEKSILLLEKEPANIELVKEIFRNIHTIKGNSGFFGYAEIEKKCMDLEGRLDSLRSGKIPVTQNLISELLKSIDNIQKEIQKTAGSIKTDNNPGSSKNIVEPAPITEYKPIGEILVEMGAVSNDTVEKALEEQDRPLGEILVESGKVEAEIVEKALQIQKSQLSAQSAAGIATDYQRKEIRVDTAKLDKLFDLVGELITAETMVINNPDLHGLKLENFTKAGNMLNKICREIQETTMMVRMIPLEGLFTKMTRLVRDLSRKSNKKINFEFSGQETEMDKNVIEQISDPLVHIIRNSIDHGIEIAETRVENGKNETGNIKLNAKYEGSEIWISIKDDGAGLNREKIIHKALEKGLLKEPVRDLKDREVWQIIFEPGFSTADKVTEVSGRGVGMDVVKKNIDKLRGKIEIISEAGKNCEFILKIPLTMAIIDGITIKTGDNFYSIPLIDILEFFRAKEEQITRTSSGSEVVNLRGSLMPLIRMYEVFNVKSKYTKATEGTIIVVQSANKKACLFIDEIIGNQQIVIKSLSDYLGKVDGVSGCTILGDGSVSFIIDTGTFISRWVE